MNTLKRFFKELKRIRWAKLKDVNDNFWKVIVFTAFVALILFSLAISLTAMWNSLGVGING